jgi:hypothetical protein
MVVDNITHSVCYDFYDLDDESQPLHDIKRSTDRRESKRTMTHILKKALFWHRHRFENSFLSLCVLLFVHVAQSFSKGDGDNITHTHTHAHNHLDLVHSFIHLVHSFIPFIH